MDIPRQVKAQPWWRQRRVVVTAAALAVGAGIVMLRQWQPGGARVDADTVSIAEVSAGPMDVSVRANGLLLPSEVRFVAAQVEARVEEVRVKAGAAVQAGDVVIVMSNPILNQQADESRWALQAIEAELNALRVQLRNEQLNQQATVTKAQFAYDSAALQFDAQSKLIATHVVSQLEYRKTELSVKQLAETLALEQQRLHSFDDNVQAQLRAKEAQVEKLRKTWQRAQEQVQALQVKAPIDGMVQQSDLQPGQRVVVGANLIKMAKPDSLYAELQVQEMLARDLAVGQSASIDTRNGIVAGVITRVDLAVTKGVVKVDVKLIDALPKGARPDLSIEGIVHVAELAHTVQVQRPMFAQNNQTTTVFKLSGDDVAERVPVQFGIASSNSIEIKSGLNVGDRIVISDTSKWDNNQRLQLN